MLTEFREYFTESEKLPKFDSKKLEWERFDYDHLKNLLVSSGSGPELKFVRVNAIPVNIHAGMPSSDFISIFIVFKIPRSCVLCICVACHVLISFGS